MKCQNCGKKEANTHFRQNVNGQTTELWLCSDCAEQLGIGGMFSSFGSFGSFGSLGGFGGFGGFDSLLGSMFGGKGTSLGIKEAKKCPACGATFSDIAESGRVGCADCYDSFAEQLAPSIIRTHGRVSHVGKHPSGAVSSEKADSAKAKPNVKQNDSAAAVNEKQTKIAELKAQLKKAIETEQYEEAARLRDIIKQLEA